MASKLGVHLYHGENKAQIAYVGKTDKKCFDIYQIF